MLCERCGSINIVRARSTSFERVWRFFTGRKKFLCRRCGWTALRAWDENAPRDWKQPSLRIVDVDDEDFDIDRFH